jgi:aminoglycoside 2'-N-acetyltransferase I
MTLTIFQSDDEFVSQNQTALRSLMSEAYEDDFSEEDWLHTYGGIRFVGTYNGEIVAHGAVVPREIQINRQARRVGYLEGMAVSRRFQRQGFGSKLLSTISETCATQYELSMLSTDEFNFYGKFGWRRFEGKSGVIINGAVTLTPEDDDGLMYLVGETGLLEEIRTAYCDWRNGDYW